VREGRCFGEREKKTPNEKRAGKCPTERIGVGQIPEVGLEKQIRYDIGERPGTVTLTELSGGECRWGGGRGVVGGGGQKKKTHTKNCRLVGHAGGGGNKQNQTKKKPTTKTWHQHIHFITRPGLECMSLPGLSRVNR